MIVKTSSEISKMRSRDGGTVGLVRSLDLAGWVFKRLCGAEEPVTRSRWSEKRTQEKLESDSAQRIKRGAN